jgi:hypothetical protein
MDFFFGSRSGTWDGVRDPWDDIPGNHPRDRPEFGPNFGRGTGFFGGPFENMMRDADEMMRTFDNMFGGQAIIIEEPPDMIPAFEAPDARRSPRDLMLKPPEEGPSNRQVVRRDQDLDDQVSVRGLDSVLRPQQPEESRNPFGFSGFSSSSSSSSWSYSGSFGGPGKVEERHTFRDSQGNEKETLTRKFGDKTYSMTKKRTATGSEEFDQNMVNMSEEELREFERLWNGHPSRPGIVSHGQPGHGAPTELVPRDSDRRKWWHSFLGK